ncbi:hypothetical protein D3C72_1061200 [compost metagenome]
MNRKMKPGYVWLLLIPLFKVYWMFVVAKRISETIEAEYSAKGQPLPTAKPTYTVGFVMAILGVISALLSIKSMPEQINQIQRMLDGVVEQAPTAGGPLSVIAFIISLASFVLWIVYWVQTAGYKNKMKMLPNNKGNDSQIFQGM